MRLTLLAIVICHSLLVLSVSAQDVSPQWPQRPAMDLPKQTLLWLGNPDGSCVQCAGSMVGAYRGDMNQASLLWDTEFGKAIRGGSTPSRVANYCKERGIPIYNVTSNSVDDTIRWARWSVKTGRFAAIGYFDRHFQTLYGYDNATQTWIVMNNWYKTDPYLHSETEFRRHHAASGPWIVIPKGPPAAPNPRYVKWW